MRDFRVVTVIGVGLLGGSIGLGLKARGWNGTIRGVGRRESSLKKALELGAIDEAYLDPAAAVPDADFVVICTPANLVIPMLDVIAAVAKKQAVVTDVASTKAQICQHVFENWSRPVRFIGSHPMAGSEKFGPENATRDLYTGSAVIVEKQQEWHDPTAQRLVREFWMTLGGVVYEMDPEEHDIVLAKTSHVPHIAASCLALLADVGKSVRPMLGGGFRDTTRIAAGNPEIWRDICLTNSKAIVDALQDMERKIQEVAQWVEQQDGDRLEVFFAKARDARRKLLEE